MNRQLIPSGAFIRAARKYLKKHPHMAAALQATLTQLSENAFHPGLKTHKLR